MTIPDLKPWFSKAGVSWLISRRGLVAMATLLALILTLALFSRAFRRVAIVRCPANAIEVGRTTANEPACLPKQH